jgi:RNA polymerase sigma factor (sigma-70 family)
MKSSEQRALDQLLADGRWIRRLAAVLVRDPADADDVAQATIVAAIERPPSSASEPRRWLAAVGRNVARMMGRTDSRRARHEALVEPGAVSSPEALFERAQLHSQLATLLTQLEEPYRTTLLLCYFEELRPAEVAKRLGIPAGTVRWRLKQGLDRLRSRLDRLHANRRPLWLVPMTDLGRVTKTRHMSIPIKGVVLMAKKTTIAAGLGALAATTALVSLYEGRAVIARRQERASVAAAERRDGATANASTRLADGMAMIARRVAPPADGVTRAELLKRDAEQRAEIVRLRAQLDWERRPVQFKGVLGAKHGEDFFKPSKDELLQLAKECSVRGDFPQLTVPATTMPDDFAVQAGVTDDERREFDRVSAEFTESMLSQLRALYVEVTGDKNGADTLDAFTMMGEMRAKVPEAVSQQAYWRLSHERAGLIPTAADVSAASPFERLLRLEMSAGDTFENSVAAALGADRAHALRTEQGSWGIRLALRGCPGGQ